MKMNNKSTLVLAIVACIAIIASSCKDKFTEEDLLNAQQTIDYSVVFKDVATLLGIEGATVTIVQNGVELTATTNALGVATFLKISIGNGFPLTITATDYATVTSNVFNSSVDYRQAEETDFFYTLSQTASLGTVKGVIEIQSDLTNQSVEKLGAAEVTAVFVPSTYNNLSLGSINFTITATSETDGTYTFDLPTFGDGVQYSIYVNDIEINQTIAYSREQGQPLFPATLPQVANVLTAFSSGAGAAVIPSGVPSVFATVAGSTGTPAQLSITVNGAGVITGSLFPVTGGSGYTDNPAAVVTVTSLAGGSGAVMTANIVGGSVIGLAISNGGTGYPAGNPGANFTTGASSPLNLVNSIIIRPNDIKVIDIDYGTGTSRAIDIL